MDHLYSCDGLTSNTSQLIYQDRSGIFWCQSAIDLQRFDGEKWTRVNLEGADMRWPYSIFQDQSGQMWFGHSRGVARYDGKTWTAISAEDGFVGRSVRSIVQDRSGDLWFSTRGSGVYRFDGQHFTRFTTEDGLVDNVVTSILEDRDGVMWFGTEGGVSRYDPSAGSSLREATAGKAGQAAWTSLTEEDGLPDNRVASIFQDRAGQMWFGTQAGVSRYTGRVMTTLTTQDGLPGNQVQSGLMDRDGNLWFSVFNQGVLRHDGKEWTAYRTEDGLISNNVFGMIQDRSGKLWFAAQGGISRFDLPVDGQHRTRAGTFTTFDRTDRLMMPRAEYVGQALEDRSGKLWFVQSFGGVVRYDGKSWTNISSADLGHPSCNVVFQDRDGIVWFGNWNTGTTRYDGQQFTRYMPKDGLANDRVWSILQDRSGDVWFGTTKGVSRWDGKAFTNYPESDGLEDSQVVSMFEDRDGHLWFGTEGAGLYRYDGRMFQRLTQADGLSGNAVTTILQDADGVFWFGTSGGITRFDPPDPLSPSVAIDGVVADRRYEEISELAVSTDVAIVTFEFQGISFKTRPDGIVYRYRLKGYDSDWLATRERRVEYENLPRGIYTFEVHAVDRDLVYSELPATFSLTVALPYERFGWMGALGISIVLIAWQTTRVVRRGRRLQEANDALSSANRDLFAANREIQEQTERKSAFLASMSHELRTPMNAIRGFTNLVLRRSGDVLPDRQKANLVKVTHASDHLLAMINDLLDLSKIEAGRMDVNVSSFDVSELVESCVSTVSPLVQEGVDLRFEVADGVGEAQTDEARLRQMLINLTSNAIKFTDSGTVKVVAGVHGGREQGGEELVIRVTDTGKGIPADELSTIFDEYRQVKGQSEGEASHGTGLGLSITRRFAELLGGSVEVASIVGEGSTFSIRIPAEFEG